MSLSIKKVVGRDAVGEAVRAADFEVRFRDADAHAPEAFIVAMTEDIGNCFPESSFGKVADEPSESVGKEFRLVIDCAKTPISSSKLAASGSSSSWLKRTRVPCIS